jgi:hypothetical protein
LKLLDRFHGREQMPLRAIAPGISMEDGISLPYAQSYRGGSRQISQAGVL